jgi:hypothetical protein
MCLVGSLISFKLFLLIEAGYNVSVFTKRVLEKESLNQIQKVGKYYTNTIGNKLKRFAWILT